MKKKQTNFTVVREHILVYDKDDDIPIGWGYMYTRGDGKLFVPELWDIHNAPLDNGMYRIVKTDKQELVILNRTIQ